MARSQKEDAGKLHQRAKDFGNYEFTEIEQEPEEIKGLKN